MRIPITSFKDLRFKSSNEISKLIEIQHRTKLRNILVDAVQEKRGIRSHEALYHGLSQENLRKAVDASMLTFLLHWLVESIIKFTNCFFWKISLLRNN